MDAETFTDWLSRRVRSATFCTRLLISASVE
jgi:hypothetical protein